MALAFSLQTRPDLCVYLVNLQRYAQKPKGIHIRRLNAITRYAQSHQPPLTYTKMAGPYTLECHSDAGFKKETDDDGHVDGKAIRGANYLRRGHLPTSLGRSSNCHLIEWSVGMIKQVARSTFTAEAGALILATDHMPCVLGLHFMKLNAV